MFDSRSESFRDDGILQENVIIHAVKSGNLPDDVLVSSNSGPRDRDLTVKYAKRDTVVYPDDPHRFIHIVPDE